MTIKLNTTLPSNKPGQFSNLQTLPLLLSAPIHFSILSLIKINSHGVWGEPPSHRIYIYLTLAEGLTEALGCYCKTNRTVFSSRVWKTAQLILHLILQTRRNKFHTYTHYKTTSTNCYKSFTDHQSKLQDGFVSH